MTVLLSFGEVLVDLLPTDATGKHHQPIAGGAPANVAVGYAKLGGKSYFAGGISADHYGVMLKQALADQGWRPIIWPKCRAPLPRLCW
ncbi:hypothetical protein LFREDSHE_00750 [Shewanella baltica]